MPICRVKSAAVDEQRSQKTNTIMRSQMVGLDLGNGFELPFRVGLGQRPAYPAGPDTPAPNRRSRRILSTSAR
jgi:hypothetical protein